MSAVVFQYRRWALPFRSAPMRPTEHPKVASVGAELSRAEPQEAQRELWRRGREEFRLDSQFARCCTRLVVQTQSINGRQMSISKPLPT